MGITKFNIHSRGEYWENYFKKDREFYKEISLQIEEFLTGLVVVGIDVGAGPGVGAKIFEDLKIKAKIIGYEPSKTHADGEELSKELEEVEYLPVNKSIEEIKEIKNESLDFILFLRSGHEIADSLGGKEIFFGELKRINKALKVGGVVVFADPCYKDLNCSMDIVEKVQEYQLETIGHTHIPSDYIFYKEIIENLRNNFKINKQKVIENEKISQYLKQKYCLDIKPCVFYIITLEKQNK